MDEIAYCSNCPTKLPQSEMPNNLCPRCAKHAGELAFRRTLVEALDNALNNGYDMLAMTDSQIAEDIVEYCADLECVSAEDLIPEIAAWRGDRIAR